MKGPIKPPRVVVADGRAVLQVATDYAPCAPLWCLVSFLSRGTHLREVKIEVWEVKGDVVSLSLLGKIVSPCCRDS